MAQPVRTAIGFFLLHGKAGDTLTVERLPGNESGIAERAQRSGCTVTTERVIVVGGSKSVPTASPAIRVTIAARLKD